MNKIQHGLSTALLFVSLILIVFQGCTDTAYPPSKDVTPAVDPPTVAIIDLLPSATPGTHSIKFQYHLNPGYPGGKLRLYITPPNSGEEQKIDYPIPLEASPYSTSTYSFNYNFTELGKYTLQAEMEKASGGKRISAEEMYYLTITKGPAFAEFPIIQLLVSGETLWPSYFDNTVHFYAPDVRYEAFKACETSIKFEATLKNVDAPSSTYTDWKDLDQWAMDLAFKDVTIDRKKTILCALTDIATLLEPTAIGVTTPKTSSKPYICYILNSRIRTTNYSPAQKAYMMVGTAIHELGHATGIQNDGATINPPHADPDKANCVMLPDAQPNNYTLKFCGGHINFIKIDSWLNNQ